MNLKLTIFFFLIINSVLAQKEINWDVSYNKEVNSIVLNAQLNEGWYIYSQFLDKDAGPIPTSISFEANKDIKIGKKFFEPEGLTVFDKNFNSEITYFKNEVDFKVEILKVKRNTTLKGSVLYMICNEDGCLPPDEYKFELDIN